MTEHSTTMLLLCALAALVNGAVAVWSYRRRQQMHAAVPFAVLNLSEMVWHLGHFAETWASDLGTKLWWDSFQNLPAAAIGPATLWVAFDYLRMRTSRKFWWLITLVAAGLTLPLASEPIHHLLRRGAALEGSPAMLVYPFGLLDFGLGLVIYGSALTAFVLLARGIGQVASDHMPQRLALALALTSPVLTTTVGMTLQLRIDGDRDLSPVTMMIGALMAAWGLARHRLFDLAPVARDAVIANLPDGVFVIDPTGRVTDMNRAAAALSDAKVGATYRDVFSDWPAVVELLNAGDTRTTDVGYAPRPPKRVFEATYTRLTDEEGRAGGYTLVLRDVSAARQRLEQETSVRHQAEAALVVSNERFGALFDQTFQLTGLLDHNGHLLAANRASLQMINHEPSDVIGLPFWETPWWSHSAEQQAVLRAAIERCARGEFVRFQAEHPDADGKTHYVDFSLTPIRDARGQVVEMVPEGRDVTSLPEERERADQLAAQLQQAQRLDSMGRMAGGLAHDFNNLLTVIVCSVELANDKLPESSEAREHLGSIKQAADTAGEITRGLLAFGRQQPVLTRQINLNEIVRTTEKLVRRLIRPNVQIVIEATDDVWDVRADASQLQQVVMNLILNAQDAMPNGGTLRLRTRNTTLDADAAHGVAGRGGELVCLDVIDNGTGMTAAVRARVFEPFYSTKEHGKGTGLGLAIVHGVVTQLGGWIDLQSAPGMGSTFTLYFPRAPSTQPSPLPERSVQAEPERRPLIYVVDDQAPVRRAVARVLESEGHRVRTFAAAAEVLASDLSQETPDLLVTDIVMPEISGLELADTLSTRLPRLRVLIISGYAESNQLELISRLPSEAFLAKPFSSTDLANKVKDALRNLPTWSELGRRRLEPSQQLRARTQ